MKIRVINLDRTPERMRTFEAANAHLKQVERFPAIDGTTVSREELVAKGVISRGLPYTDGAIGAALSHMHLWHEAPVTIAEDDAAFHHDFEATADALLARTPNWEIVLRGWSFNSVCCFNLVPNTPCAVVGDEETMLANVPTFRTAAMPHSLYKLRQAFGIVCYSISIEGARKLTAAASPIVPFALTIPLKAQPVPNYGIDMVMAAQYEKLNAFICFPPLVLFTPGGGESTIQPR